MQAPNGTTTRPVRNFSLPQDSIDYVNTVVVVGATGTDGVDSTVVYRGGSPPAAGTSSVATLASASY